jgi:alpha-1,6-mannosyltransferase
MKIVQVANFVHETSGGMRTALRALQTQYLAHGHEVVLIRPGIESQTTESDGVTNFMIRGPVLPMTGGYRVIVGRRELKHILRSLQPDGVELSDKSPCSGCRNGARRTALRVLSFLMNEQIWFSIRWGGNVSH